MATSHLSETTGALATTEWRRVHGTGCDVCNDLTQRLPVKEPLSQVFGGQYSDLTESHSLSL